MPLDRNVPKELQEFLTETRAYTDDNIPHPKCNIDTNTNLPTPEFERAQVFNRLCSALCDSVEHASLADHNATNMRSFKGENANHAVIGLTQDAKANERLGGAPVTGKIPNDKAEKS